MESLLHFYHATAATIIYATNALVCSFLHHSSLPTFQRRRRHPFLNLLPGSVSACWISSASLIFTIAKANTINRAPSYACLPIQHLANAHIMVCTDIFPHRLKKTNIIFAGDKRKNLPVSFATRSIDCTRKERICSPSFPRYNAMAFFSFSRRNRLNARMRLCGECMRLRFLAFAPVSETDDVDADASETSSSSSSSSAPDVALSRQKRSSSSRENSTTPEQSHHRLLLLRDSREEEVEVEECSRRRRVAHVKAKRRKVHRASPRRRRFGRRRTFLPFGTTT